MVSFNTTVRQTTEMFQWTKCLSKNDQHVSGKKSSRKLKDFALKMHSMFINTYEYESTFSVMKQVKSENRNRMAVETLDYSLQLAIHSILVLMKER